VKEPGFFLLVRFWIAPQAEAQVIRWLEGGHVAEVLRQPGFLWCRRIRLAETDANGWGGYSMIYGIGSEQDFEVYNRNKPLTEKFARERAPFEKQLKIERFAGPVDFALDAPTLGKR
jgi:hypothetical protein